MKLAKLPLSAARGLLTRDFLHGAKPRYSEGELEPHVVRLGRDVALGAVEEGLRGLSTGSLPREPKIDVDVAKLLHKQLPLSRHEAADPGVWNFVAIAVMPELIRHRWDTEQSTTRTRFFRPGTRPDSNYYGRLWWIAELTAEGGSYRLTERVFENQSLATGLFVRKLSHRRELVSACVEVLGAEGSATVEAALRGLQKLLSVYSMAYLSESDFVRLLKELPVVRKAT